MRQMGVWAQTGGFAYQTHASRQIICYFQEIANSSVCMWGGGEGAVLPRAASPQMPEHEYRK